MNKKNVIIGVCIGAGVLAAGLIVAGIVIANKPEVLLARAITNDINDFRNSEEYKYYQDVVNGGSISVSSNMQQFVNDDLYMRYDIYPDIARGQGAIVLGAYDDDWETLATAQLNYSPKDIIISSPELLDDDVYGIDLVNLEDNIEGSFLDPDEDGELAFLGQYLLNLSSSLDTNKTLEGDSYKIAEDYRSLFINAIVENSVVTKSSETITVAGEKIPCTVVTIETDMDGLSEALLEIIDYAEDDEKLEDYLRDVLFNGAEDPDDLLDRFYDALDEIKENLEDVEESDGELVWDCYITKSGTRLARVDVELSAESDDGEEHSVTASLVLGKRINNIKEITLDFSMDEDEGLKMVYTVNENSSKAFSAELEYELKYERQGYDYESYEPTTQEELISFDLQLDWDKKSGDYTVKVETARGDENANIEIEFNVLDKGGTRTISFADMDLKIKDSDDESINRDLDKIRDLELVIVTERRAKAPKAPKTYEEITDLDEDDAEDILDDVMDELEDIFEDYNPYI